MASCQDNFLLGKDLDAVLKIIDNDIFNFEPELDQEFNDIINKLTIVESSCELCTESYKTKRGLARHMNTKHNTGEASEKLHPLLFHMLIKKSASKLVEQDLYTKEMQAEFQQYMPTIKESNQIYNRFRRILIEFNGDAELFYPNFYKIVVQAAEELFSGLSRNSNLTLGFELASQVLAHLTNSTIIDDVVVSRYGCHKFTEKENSIISYISGYVFGTMYRRIRYAKFDAHDKMYHEQCLSLLLAGKLLQNSEDSSSNDQELIKALNCDGIWKLSSYAIRIFSAVELYFLSAVENFTTKIVCTELVSAVMYDSWVLDSIGCITENCEEKVEKEFSINLFEDLVTLYLRARIFSHSSKSQ